MKRWVAVLVSPQEGGNVGAAARAVRNFGAGGLRVVEPRCEVNGEDARRFASGAADLLRTAQVYPDLDAALADRGLAIGMSGVFGRHHRLDCDGFLPTALLANKGHVAEAALVFGREDRGLLGAEMERCDYLWSLPTNPAFPSLNLAQAVVVALAMVCEAERQLAPGGAAGAAHTEKSMNPLLGSANPGDAPAERHELLVLEERLAALMHRTGWIEDRRTRNSVARVKNLLVRGNATQRDVRLLLGIFHQARLAVEHPETFAKFASPYEGGPTPSED